MFGIELFTGKPNRPYKVLGSVTAKQDEGNIAECNLILIELATKMGADAIINITYDRKVSWTSWRQLVATGTAVKFKSDEKVCPDCAEKIKRAANKCRFCGFEFNVKQDKKVIQPRVSEVDKDIELQYRGYTPPPIFNVTLIESGPNKTLVIKALRSLKTLSIQQAQDLISNAPSLLTENMSKEEAEVVQKNLELVGCRVSLEEVPRT